MAGLGLVATLAFSLLLPPARRFKARPFRLRVHAAAVGDHLRTPVIRRLCGVALLMMAGFVATYNYLTYRLESAPFSLPPAAGGLVFLAYLAYLAGTVTSTVAGRMADRYGRRPVLVIAIAVALTGLALTLPNVLPSIVIGLFVFTGGFFSPLGGQRLGIPAGSAQSGPGLGALSDGLLPRLEPWRQPNRLRLERRRLAAHSRGGGDAVVLAGVVALTVRTETHADFVTG